MPSTTVCYSGTDISTDGWVMIKTTDGGSTWNIQTLPSDIQFDDVACPSTTTCYAVGSSADDNTARLSPPPMVVPLGPTRHLLQGMEPSPTWRALRRRNVSLLNRERPAATLRSSAQMTVERRGAPRPFPSRPGVSRHLMSDRDGLLCKWAGDGLRRWSDTPVQLEQSDRSRGPLPRGAGDR